MCLALTRGLSVSNDICDIQFFPHTLVLVNTQINYPIENRLIDLIGSRESNGNMKLVEIRRRGFFHAFLNQQHDLITCRLVNVRLNAYS